MISRKRVRMPERPVLDTGYLDRLEDSLGQAVTAELLSDGMIELADRLARLERLAANGEAAELAALAHDIVSVAGHMGLGALSGAAAELSRALSAARETGAALDGAAIVALAAGVTSLGPPSLAALSERSAATGS